MSDQRFHLTLTTGGRPAAHGWWASEETARRKFTVWVGEYGSLPQARVALVGETTGAVVTAWPKES
ncbi:hypothetical protein [Streptomyces sp. NPDC056160]|uniref:hypothetical protein n=1 Tax=Streptomyces sp. NPDC056160 TaxID=3345731 RepID=UPI0035D73555